MRALVFHTFCLLLLWTITGCERQEPAPTGERNSSSASASAAGERDHPHASNKGECQEGEAFVGFDRQPNEYLELVDPVRPPREIKLVSVAVISGPVVDGDATDPSWSQAKPIQTLDRSSQQLLEIKSVHTSDEIFLLVSFEDHAASVTHKSWVWSDQEGIYKQGPDREDMFILKWSMNGLDANLSIYRNPQPHQADIWFWKACRTDPMGYADDKNQLLSETKSPKTAAIKDADGGTLYLSRKGDDGASAYEELIPADYGGPIKPRFVPRTPDGSRADVRAKGRWSHNRWTIEFGRRLDTGNSDDLTLEIKEQYLLGVARYEMSHTGPNLDWTQPLYKSGDVFDRIVLLVAE